jgi:hypothetical protein
MPERFPGRQDLAYLHYWPARRAVTSLSAASCSLSGGVPINHPPESIA